VATVLGVLFGFAGMGSAAAAIALTPMAEDYGISVGTAAWTISLYALMLGVGTAVYGRIADLVGTRYPMLAGLVLMTTGALVAALAPSFPLHLAGRLLQGAGVAAVPTLGAAIVSARYEGEIRTAALLRMAGTAAAVTSLGPLAGGIAVDTLGWRVAIGLPILGVLMVPALWHAMDVGGTGARLDYLGAILTALAAAGVVLLIQSPSTGVAVALAGAGLVVLGVPAVVMWVRHRPHGFLPMSVVRNPRVVRSAIAAASVPASWFALLVGEPVVLLSHGWESWQVGLTLVPSGVLSLFMPRIVGPLMNRITPGRALMLSTSVSVGALLLAAAGTALASAPLLIVAVLCVTFAFGIGQPALSTAVGAAVEPDVRGVALGVATLMFMVGGSVGSAVVGGLGQVIGLGEAMALLAVLPVVGLLVVAPTRRAAA
jgi:MFS family permease